MAMRRWSRAVFGAVLALFMVVATSAPGVAATAKPLPQQWWFTTWGVEERLWPVTQGKGVTVAVLDTGVQASIPDLSGVVLPGTDAEGGGGDGRTDTDDAVVSGHGTGMASLIAAQGNGTGFLGVAPQARILPVVVKSTNAHAVGIRYAVDHGAKVINISRGAPATCPPATQDAVSYALQHDVVVLAAAGNDGNESNSAETPANCAGVLAVGAVDARFNPWIGTQRQSYVAVAAPGVGVGSVIKDGQYHNSPAGTSGATALTSAAVALVRSKFPDMPARQVVQQVVGSAGDVGAKGKDDQTGYGLIRPYRILNGSVPKSGPNPVFEAYDKWAAANKAASPGAQSGNNDDRFSSFNPIAAIGIPAVIVAVIVILLVNRGRGRRRSHMAGPGQYGQADMPQTFGGPYPLQDGQPSTPGGQQQSYYPPAGAGPQGAPPPPQGQYPDPRQWGSRPPDRQ
jgi:type VII secretion-associated serine protease mycosin